MRLIISYLLGSIIFGFSQSPQVSVQSVNSESVGLYEKFEVNVCIENVNYSNAYDPNEVDLRAVFTAPSGKVWEIFGFYDNYNSVNQWKVRFAANEPGNWNYYLTLNSNSGQAQSAVSSFETVDSDYHGWIRVSPINRHYFIHDDGTPFYGVGPYYPWNVNNSSTGLGQLEASECNFWGYWNIMYDTGEIIESMNSGLSRYDQPKCGRIDQLIIWSEDRNLKMMLAIWPHDLLSNTVWVHQWHQNPYNTICEVGEFFESEVAWDYQEKQYRYIIARWGYSRALAVWEIVNEVNGTDGWVAGKVNEARIWVGKVHDFLTANDPHQRPTTASQSGGIYWPEGYAEVDIPNVHVYETGWPAEYLGNPLRSSAYNYYKLADQFWNDFEKPAIFGEAGYKDSYGNFVAGSDEYTAMFHNALWASWGGGLAATPVWWAFNSKELMTADVMDQMHRFSQIARDYNYAYQDFQPYEIISQGCDVYAMRSESSIFGWAREIYGNSVKGQILQFKALEDTSYQITWYNTWTAESIGQSYITGIDTLVTVSIPETAGEIPDVAFFIKKTAEGTTPSHIRMGTATTKMYVKRDEKAHILCTIHDAEGRYVRSADNPIQFHIEGPGSFIGPDLVNTEAGMAQISFTADSTSGIANIIASSPDLKSDTLTIEVTNRIWIDNFEGYESNSNLDYFWFIRSGTTAEISRTNSITGELGTGLRINYSIGEGNAPYAGVYKFIDEDLSLSESLEFWLKGDGSGRTLAILLFEKYGRYWQYNHILSNNNSEFFRIPIDGFTASDTASTIKLDAIDEVSFNILKGTSEFGQGTFYLDDINFVIPAIETAIRQNKNNHPVQFRLMQNYPNPFNSSTTIKYEIPTQSDVQITIYNTLGQVIETFVRKAQSAGTHIIKWDANHISSGVYFYNIKVGDMNITKKCVLMK